MASADSAPPVSPADLGPKPSTPSRGLVIAAMAILLAFVAIQGLSLCNEWLRLQKDLSVVRKTAVVGYANIHPSPSYARKPEDWFHHEGESTLLWSGWRDGGHGWFRVGRGEVELSRISSPVGRDVVQAIDYPIVENGDGDVWRRIPTEAPVVGLACDGVMSVYPLQVLGRVAIINDLIGTHPLLLTYNPDDPQGVYVYEPLLEGHRITLGMSGYFHDRKPLLYDRGSESLWVQDNEGALGAIAGRYKGSRLRPIARPAPVSWGDWQRQHPKSRLLIGADRSKHLPAT